MPLFNQESKTIMIREELYFFFNQFVMFFKIVTKLVTAETVRPTHIRGIRLDSA